MTTSPSKPAVQNSFEPPPGRLGNLSVPQQDALDNVRKELQTEGYFVPERHDDATLLRFLRARQFDVVKAKEMIIAAEKWRKAEDVDNIANFDYTEQAAVNKYYPQYYHKVDKDGRPLYIERLGMLDIKALYNITTQQRQLKHLVQEYEKMINVRFPACSAKVGHPIETNCTILDLHNVGVGQFYRVKDYVFAAAQIGQNNYPETMGKFYICNAPYLFMTVWAIIKSWLDPVTVSKITVLGKDKTQLFAQIPSENLPKELGGTCECVGGCSMSDMGPWNEVTITDKIEQNDDDAVVEENGEASLET